jgi:hypothetical protein
MKKYDWYWRLDTDSFILDTIDYDVFSFMDKNNLKYGYNCITTDPKEMIVDLKNTFNIYLKQKKIKPKSISKLVFGGIWKNQNFYTNFTITKTSFWKSKKVLDFLKYIDKSEGIYKFRWGDTPLHFLTVGLFLDFNEIHNFNDIFYKHQGKVIIPEKYLQKRLISRIFKKIKNKFYKTE